VNIRSITAFVDPGYPVVAERLAEIGAFLTDARGAYEAAGFTVQMVRLATLPFPALLGDGAAARAVTLAEYIERLCQEHAIDYSSLGAVMPDAALDYVDAIHDILAATQRVFAAVTIASADGIHLAMVRRTAELIQAVSRISPDGFGNLRLAALANCPPGSPFFPAAYHAGGPPTFAIATEAADLAVSAFEAAPSLASGWANLVALIESNAEQIVRVAGGLVEGAAGTISFGGIDFSLAPFPELARSLGAALERLGATHVGAQGSLFAAALLADALDRAAFPRCGFSGLMLPVLEDAVLAERAAAGEVSINDLLLYSAVCGAGLDTLPLPGDIGVDDLAAILLDVAALSTRLGKPLTARLMPIPGLAAGDRVTFDFPYFADSRVLSPKGAGLGRLLRAGERHILLGPRLLR
jgi:uncharacterized protein (UPF0210 family)